MGSATNAADEVGLTRELSAWISGLSPDRIPTSVADRIRLLLLDSLGAALYGRSTSWAGFATEWALRNPSPTGGATLWGSDGRQLRACDAALVNGIATHAFELDDFHNAKVHPGAVIVPAVLAIAESRGIRGPVVTAALVVAYEVMVRVALALDPAAARSAGWHLTAVTGPIGAAAGAAVLLGLDAEKTAWAIGLAGTQSSGLFAFTADGSMSKRFHAGRAAQSGILAAELAEIGMTGPASVFETSDGGHLAAFSPTPRPHRLNQDLGQTWHCAETSFKPYSACGSIHAYIDAARQLRNSWRPGAKVRAGVAKVVMLQCGFHYEPASALIAQLHLGYCVGAAFMDGNVLPAQFQREAYGNPERVALARSIEIAHDPDLDSVYPEHFAGWVELETHEGVRRVDRLDPSGHPTNLDWERVLREKFRYLAGNVIGQERARLLEAGVDALDTQDIASLTRLLAN